MPLISTAAVSVGQHPTLRKRNNRRGSEMPPKIPISSRRRFRLSGLSRDQNVYIVWLGRGISRHSTRQRRGAAALIQEFDAAGTSLGRSQRAAAAFVGTHFPSVAPAAQADRRQCPGSAAFLGITSVVASATLGWLALTYRAAPAGTLSRPVGDGLWAAVTAAMLAASVLLMGLYRSLTCVSLLERVPLTGPT